MLDSGTFPSYHNYIEGGGIIGICLHLTYQKQERGHYEEMFFHYILCLFTKFIYS